MASVTALWLSFDSAFSEIEQLCVEARAAELALSLKQEEAALLQQLAEARASLAPASTTKPSPGDAREARASTLAHDLAFREAHPDGPSFVELRARIRERLQWLKGELAAALTEHELHYVLLPLVIYIDELVTSIQRGRATRWEPLQSELYDIENGGELFYALLDDHLRKNETHPIVFQMFYFCLSDGFVGMAESDPRKITQYKLLLADRIPLAPVAEDARSQRAESPIELVRFPWQYYAWAGAAAVAGWALLSVVARGL